MVFAGLGLASSAIGLVLFGLVMVYSASGYEEGHRLLVGQLQWAILGFIVMAGFDARRLPTLRVRRGLRSSGHLRGPAHRRALLSGAKRGSPVDRIHGWSAQPSELAKLALIFFLARFLSQREDAKVSGFRDDGASGLRGCPVSSPPNNEGAGPGNNRNARRCLLTLMFVAGVPARHLLKLAPLAMVVVYWSIFRVGWRLDRVLTFLHPDRDPQGRGFQVMQSLIAVGSGGIDGRGLGDSIQKLYYLPEPHADFIFAVVAEELGAIGAATVVVVFGFLLWRGCASAIRHPSDSAVFWDLG
jgi:cell division protein FtsW